MDLILAVVEQSTIFIFGAMLAMGAFAPMVGALVLVRLDKYNKNKDNARNVLDYVEFHNHD
jgi:hypothetical protein